MTREELESRLAGGTLLFDGAMGSMLISRGLLPGERTEEWNLRHPEVVAQVHREYREAGAQVLTTNTFGVSRAKLARKGERELRDMIVSAVTLARENACEDVLVAGDIGPSGKSLPPVGNATEKELRECFYQLASLLAEAGVDFLLIETMYDLREALLALEEAQKAATLPVVVTLTFERRPRGYFTAMGDAPERSACALEQAGAFAVGANCTLSPEEMVGLVPPFRASTSLPLLFQPNAGRPQIQGDRITYPCGPAQFAVACLEMVRRGAAMVGGCCGTTPAHIRKLREGLQK